MIALKSSLKTHIVFSQNSSWVTQKLMRVDTYLLIKLTYDSQIWLIRTVLPQNMQKHDHTK